MSSETVTINTALLTRYRDAKGQVYYLVGVVPRDPPVSRWQQAFWVSSSVTALLFVVYLVTRWRDYTKSRNQKETQNSEVDSFGEKL